MPAVMYSSATERLFAMIGVSELGWTADAVVGKLASQKCVRCCFGDFLGNSRLERRAVLTAYIRRNGSSGAVRELAK
ncbi:hypothetical protein SS05631_c14140 [Sinorhizobium sp. CCBAU 05631]|nr:hypothetical protein SS05631_c14140 [Sinorhizobium sp. CCBAU 05631]